MLAHSAVMCQKWGNCELLSSQHFLYVNLSVCTVLLLQNSANAAAGKFLLGLAWLDCLLFPSCARFLVYLHTISTTVLTHDLVSRSLPLTLLYSVPMHYFYGPLGSKGLLP